MSAAKWFAEAASDNPRVQEAIVFEMERHNFSDDECVACLEFFDAHVEGAVKQWLRDNPDVLIRAAAASVDRVWCARGSKSEGEVRS